MLAQSNTIRDIGRALPALVSGPDLAVPVSAELLDAHARSLRELHDSLHPVIDRACSVLADAMKARDPAEPADPDGEGVGAMEHGERYFTQRIEELQQQRAAFADLHAPPTHDVFRELDRLEHLYVWTVGIMQEVRWSVLIGDGIADRAASPAPRAFTSPAEWVASLDDD